MRPAILEVLNVRSVISLTVLLAGVCARPCPAATLNLGSATITLDERGCVTSLRDEAGREHAPPGSPPAFEVVTDRGLLRPTAVSRQENEILARFGEQGRMRLQVREGRGYAFLKLAELDVPGTPERLQLFCLPVKGLPTTASPMNACYGDDFATAVMGTEINVRPRLLPARAGGSDREGCAHQFEPAAEGAKEGRVAARFTATSRREDNTGWSVLGRNLAPPLDLTGCTALRAWVLGDGGGQMLKIQLFDGQGGYRDDYLKVDFTGWRHVTLDRPALNTLRYDQVRRLNLYYNALPAGRTVTCVLDGVEALVGQGEQARVVPLEDFEDASSELWPFDGTRLCAETVREFGIQPAGVGVIACPRPEFDAAIERFERASGLPSPHPGGVWSKASPRTQRSYLFITQFSEEDTDDVIAFARRGGFDAILILQSSWCRATGHYEINTTAFPRGLDGLRDTIARMKRAGFKVGLHYLAPSIYPPDPYLTPVPDRRLVYDDAAELAAGVDEKADFLPTSAPPTAFPAEDGGYYGQGAVVRVGDELIQYRERAMEPPFGLRGCVRGLLGTRAAAHRKGEPVAHLLKSYGYFLFDMNTSLLDEVAGNLARVANACDVDMIYWDGSERLQGEHWYYNAKLHKAFYDRLKNKDILFQGSSYSHYSWHVVSRMASADGHGDLKGYLDERVPSFAHYRANRMPLDIGWYYVHDTSATTDQFEYVLGKSLGFGASISLQTSPRSIREHPYIGEIVDLVAECERLRLGGQVPEATRARLREPGRDYHLVRRAGKPVLQRVVYPEWRDVRALDGESNAWEVEVKDGPCRVGFELQVVAGQWAQPGASYRSQKAVMLEDFGSLAPYTGDPANRFDALVQGPGKAGATRQGVTQRFELSEEGATPGSRCAVYSAESTLSGPDGWASIGRRFEPPLDLSWHKGIGFWLRGDGKGGKFKLQLRDGVGATDYYLTNDYTGWRYHQLPRPAADPIDYGRVTHLLFYYNALPAKTGVSCAIDDVKALPALDAPSLERPAVAVGGRALSWPITLRDGQGLVAWPGEVARVRGGDGPTADLRAVPGVVLPPGKHRVVFTAAEPLVPVVRARILLLPEETLPLEEEEQAMSVTEAGAQEVEFVSRVDGSAQRYAVRLPEGWDPRKDGDALVALHGHGSDRRQYLENDRGECAGARDVAARHGLLFVSPDYRGNSWMGPAAETDLLQILSEVRERWGARRVFLVGGSMGGTSALIFAALHPEAVAGVAAHNPMANVKEYDAYLDQHPVADIRAAIHRAYGGSPSEAPAEYETRSPELHPERFTMPVAITTGGKDASVPPESAVRLAAKLKALGRPVLQIHRPDGGHSTTYEDTVATLEFVVGGAPGRQWAK